MCFGGAAVRMKYSEKASSVQEVTHVDQIYQMKRLVTWNGNAYKDTTSAPLHLQAS